MDHSSLANKPSPPEKLTVGLIQLAFKTGDVDANLLEAGRLIDEAVQKGAQLVALGELWSFGYKVEDRTPFEETIPDGKTAQFMIHKAKEHGIYVCGGFLEKNPQGGLPFNDVLLIGPDGDILIRHHKVELYTPGGEDKSFAAGDDFAAIDTPLGRWAVLDSYDGDFPESWRIVAAIKGADLVIHPAAYESPCEDWWTKLYEASALSNAVWAVNANLAGPTADSNLFGGSSIIDPLGNTIAHASYIKEGEIAKSEVLVRELDFAEGLRLGREYNGALVGDRRTDVFRKYGL